MEQKEIYIKNVANYLRKSRGESEADLIKHKTELLDLCEKNSWKHVEYEEIGSGDSIDQRPKFQQLLRDIEEDIYDAIAVVDIDRLGRGDLGDQDRIKKTLAKAEVLVITPAGIYDLNNENDEFVIDMRSFIARMEYKQIVKRLSKGKKIGSLLGQWTNGKPPYPYEYERWVNPETKVPTENKKGLVINEEKLPIYRRIVESVTIHRKTTNQIAYELNREGIISPNKKQWNGEVIRRMLLDETHLGFIISNKTKGDGHKKKKDSDKKVKVFSREQWNIRQGNHQPVKTQEEHELIKMFLGRITKAPRIIRKKDHPLADLVKCGICGHTMQVTSRPDRKNADSIKPCWYKNGIGEKCGNSGGIAQFIYDAIEENLDSYENEVMKRIQEKKGVNTDNIEKDLKALTKRIKAQKEVIAQIDKLVETGIYTPEKYKERVYIANKDLSAIQEEYNILEVRYKYLKNLSDEERLERLQKFRNALKSDLTANEKNQLYKTIIDNIIWTRKGKDGKIEVKVNFL